MTNTIDAGRWAVKTNPQRPELYVELVLRLLQRKRFQEASKYVLQLETTVPDTPTGWLLVKATLAYRLERARLKPSTGSWEDLSSSLRRSLTAAWASVEGTDGSLALISIRHLLRNYGHDAEAVAALELLRAVVLEGRGQVHDALTALNQAVELTRQKQRVAHALLQKGRILERIRLRDTAQRHFQQVLRYEPESMAAVGALLRYGVDVDKALSDRWLEVVGRLDGRSPFEKLKEIQEQSLSER